MKRHHVLHDCWYFKRLSITPYKTFGQSYDKIEGTAALESMIYA